MAIPFGLTRQHLLVILAVVFSFNVLLLLTNAYQSQQQLRSAAETRLLSDNQRTAAVLSDFIAEQKNFALNLGESHEIETYLTNRALGMSVRYGLNANLSSIGTSFRRKLAQKTALGMPAYERILYFDEQGGTLADTSEGPAPEIVALADGAGASIVFDEKHGTINTSAAVDFRGLQGGTVMTVASMSLLSRYLNTSSFDLSLRQFIITQEGGELGGLDTFQAGDLASSTLIRLDSNVLTPLSTLPDLKASKVLEKYDLVLRVPIAGTTLSLVTALPESIVYGHITSRMFLYFTSAVPVLILLAMLWINRIRRQTLKLEADVFASRRNEEELQGQNRALSDEIAHSKALEQELRESEERYRTYIEHAPEGIFVTDLTGTFIDVNPSACNMVGYSYEELMGMSITGLSPHGREQEHEAQFSLVLSEGNLEREITLRKKNGMDMIANLSAIQLPGDIIIGFCVDITERKKTEEKIHNLAYFDPLTGLPNRRLLMDRLNQTVAGTSRDREFGAMLMLDLDHFKVLNDTQGHDVGDLFLCEVARRLTRSVRQKDTVSRLGGDEYVVIAERLGTDASAAAHQAEVLAEKIRQVLALPFVLTEGRGSHFSSASIGVALFCGKDTVIDVVLKQADVALYQAKNCGRNTIKFFNPEMQAEIDSRAVMEASLRSAITNDELQLYYQPQVDLHGTLIGAEALLRWLPPDAELIPPIQFIPLAEETGLIIPIGLLVLKKACIQLQRWQADPRTQALTLSINVNGQQFDNTDFVDHVSTYIDSYGIEASRLKLELTESVVISRVEEIIQRMQSLKELGVCFSLDDFGTGYSSLSYLKRLPLDQIKIDQSFVRDITRDQNDEAIVRAILAMCQSLGLDVIAEGVETVEQREFLLRHGCKSFQGYLFGKPVPIDAFPLQLLALE